MDQLSFNDKNSEFVNDRNDSTQRPYEEIILEKQNHFNKKYNQENKALPFPTNRFEITSKLAVGYYGKVQLVKDSATQEELALKRIRKEHVISTGSLEKIFRERKILGAIDHPFIVKMIQHYIDDKNIYILMEYCSGEDLYKYLKVEDLLKNNLMFYSAQVFMALEFLHALDIIYRDLKPENIMMCTDGYLKLTDFGFAKKINSGTSTFSCTMDYCAPELMIHGLKDVNKYFLDPYNQSVDWWSFGVLLYEMTTIDVPFDITSIGTHFYHKEINFSKIDDPSLIHLISQLLRIEVNERIGCRDAGSNEIKVHPFFNDLNWNKLFFKEIIPPFIPGKDGGDDNNDDGDDNDCSSSSSSSDGDESRITFYKVDGWKCEYYDEFKDF